MVYDVDIASMRVVRNKVCLLDLQQWCMVKTSHLGETVAMVYG